MPAPQARPVGWRSTSMIPRSPGHADPSAARHSTRGTHYVADSWYYPYGVEPVVRPLVIHTEPREVRGSITSLHICPTEHGDLVYDLPTKAFLSIEHWLHVCMPTSTSASFAIGARFEQQGLSGDRQAELACCGAACWSANRSLRRCYSAVGRNCSIDPTATIQGSPSSAQRLDRSRRGHRQLLHRQ